jgi:hypothetical protein
MEPEQLEFLVSVRRELDWVLVAIFERLIGKALEVAIKFFLLFLFLFFKSAVEELFKFLCEVSHRHWLLRIENKVHNSAVSALNGASLLPLGHLVGHVGLDSLLLLTDLLELRIDDIVDEVLRQLMLLGVLQD